MRPHHVDDDVSTKFAEVVRAYDRIFEGHEVGLCLILQQPLDTRSILERPLHVGHETGTGKTGGGAAFADAVDYLVRPIVVEGAITEMCIGPLTHVEPPVLLRRRNVNADRRKSLHVLRSPARINDVNGLFTGVKAVFDEREQNPIVIVGAVEESADMTVPAQSRPAQPYWSAMYWGAGARCKRTLLVHLLRLCHARLYRTSAQRNNGRPDAEMGQVTRLRGTHRTFLIDGPGFEVLSLTYHSLITV